MSPASSPSARALRWAGVAWFAVAAVGQAAFIAFIVAFYGVRTVTGNIAGWNDKPLIDGYTAGDDLGNLVFAAHVLLAAVVTMGGLMQLVPALRRCLPAMHRWTGRTFLVIAAFMALSGVWLVIGRGTFLSAVSGAATLLNGVLILVFGILAWRHARARRYERHRVWAMRTFMVVSGVWFLRVGIMGWVLINRGPVGMTDTMSGPADVVLGFGSYLIPLAILELYFAAGRSPRPAVRIVVAGVVLAAAAYTALGVAGAIALMWGPYI